MKKVSMLLLGLCFLLTSCTSVVRTIASVNTLAQIKSAPEGSYKNASSEEIAYLSAAYLHVTNYDSHVENLLGHLSARGTAYSIMKLNVSHDLIGITSDIKAFRSLNEPEALTTYHKQFLLAFDESEKMLQYAETVVSTRNTSLLPEVNSRAAYSNQLLATARKVFQDYKVVDPKTGNFASLWE